MSESYSVKAILSAVDQGFGSVFKGAQSTVGGLERSLKGGLGFGVMAGVGQAAFNAVAGSVKSLASDVLTVGKNFDSSMSQVQATKGISDASASFEQLNTAALSSNETFQKVAGSLDIAQDGTVNTMDALGALASQLGADTKFTATEAAEAINNLSMAGMDTQAVFENLPTVLDMATAGGIDLDYSAQLVANGLAIMGDKCSGAEEMADKLAVTASSAYGSVADFGEGLLVAGGQANICGLSLTDTYTALGILGNNGMQASEGGTMLRNTLKNLYQPTDKAAEALKDLGVQTADSEGNLRPMQDVLKDLGSAMDELNPEERSRMMSEIFDTRTIAGADALIRNCGDAWDELAGKIDNADGAAKKMAKTQLDNLAGDVTILGSAMDALKKSIFDNFNTPMRIATKLATAGISAVTDTITNMGSLFESFDLGAIQDAIDEGGFAAGLQELATQTTEQFNSMVDAAITKGPEMIRSLSDGIASGIPRALSSVSGFLQGIMGAVTANLPAMMAGGAEIIRSIQTGIGENAPALIASAGAMIFAFLAGLNANLPSLMAGGVQMLANIVSGLVQTLPKLITMAGTTIATFLMTVAALLPTVVSTGASLLQSIVQGVSQTLPSLMTSATTAVVSFVLSILESLPTILNSGILLLTSLAQGVVESLPILVAGAVQGIGMLVNTFIQFLPVIMQTGIAILSSLAQGIVQALPQIVIAILTGLTAFIQAISENLPTILQAGVQIIGQLVKGLVQALPQVLTAAVGAVKALLTGIAQNLPTIVSAGLQVVGQLITGVGQAIPSVAKSGWEIIKHLGSSIAEAIPGIIGNAVSGIKGIFSDIWGFITGKSSEGAAEAAASMQTMADSMNTSLDSVNTDGMSSLSSFADDVTSQAQSAADSASTSFDGLSTSFMDSMSGLDTSGMDSIFEGLNTSTEGLTTSFTEMGTSSSESMDSLLSSVSTSGEGINAALSGITDSFSSMQGEIGTATSSIGSDAAENLISGLDGISDTVASAMGGYADGISAGGEIAAASAQSTSEQVNTALTAGTAGATAAGTAVGNGFNDGFLKAAVKAVLYAKSIVTKLNAALMAGKGNASKAGTTLGTSFATGVNSKASAANSAGTTLKTRAISGMTGSAYSQGSSLGSSFASGVSAHSGSASSAGSSLKNGAISGMSGGGGSASSLGSTFGSSYAAGVRAKWQEAYNAGYSLGKAAAAGTQAAQVSGSPSKVAISLGKDYTNGYAIGINSNASKAVAAAKNTVKKTVKATSPAGKLKKALLTGMNDLTKYGKKYLQDSYSKLKSAATKGNFKSVSSSIAKSFKTAFNSKASSLKTSVKNQIKNITDTLKKSSKDSSFTKAGTAITNAFTKQFDTMKDKAITAATDALNKLGEKYQKKYDAIVNKQKAFYERLSKVDSFYSSDDYGNVKLADFSAATQQLSLFQSNLKKLKGALPNSLMEEIVGMDTQEGLEYTNALLKMSSSDLKKYGQSYTKYLNKASSVSKDYYSAEIKAVKDAYTKEAKTVYNDLQKKMTDIGKNAVISLSKAMTSQSKTISDAGKKLMQNMEKSIVTAYKSTALTMAKSGKYTADGLYKAIVKNLGLTSAAGKALAKSVSTSYAKQLKIKSPSRVMYALGENTVEGAVNAIKAGESEMWEAAGKLVRIPSMAAAKAPDMDLKAARDYSLDEEFTYHHESTVYVPFYINGRKFAEATSDDMTDVQNRKSRQSLRKQGIA